jgi:hypothetical protein
MLGSGVRTISKFPRPQATYICVNTTAYFSLMAPPLVPEVLLSLSEEVRYTGILDPIMYIMFQALIPRLETLAG